MKSYESGGREVMIATPQFRRSVADNLKFWRQTVDGVNERNVRVLSSEWENVRRAVRFGSGLSQTWRDAASLVVQCFDLIEQRGTWSAWIPLLEELVGRCDEGDTALRGRLLNSLGSFYRREHQLDEALRTHRAEESVGHELQDKSRLAHARLNLCKTYRLLHNYDKAEQNGWTALQLFSELGSAPEKMGPTFNELGLIAHSRGDLASAEHYLTQAAACFRPQTRPVSRARTLQNLANAQQAAGETELALQNYQEAASLLKSTDCELDKTRLQLSLGTLYLTLGRLQEAEAAYRRANSTYLQRSGHVYYQAMVANNLGNVYLARGQLADAERCLQVGASLYRQINARLMLANTLGDLAQTRAAQGKTAAARSLYDEALSITAAFPDDAWGREMDETFREARDGLRDK